MQAHGSKSGEAIADPDTPEPVHDSSTKGAHRYRAPALEKGLDILEALAAVSEPLTTPQLAERLGRSPSELFRMIYILERRGYIEESRFGQGYELTNKAFTLSMSRAQVRALIDIALPVMRELAALIDQSCHIAVTSGDQMVVLARVENPGPLGFSVRPGYRRAIYEATSGLTLYSFQPEAIRREWDVFLRRLAPKDKYDAFIRQSEAVRARGFAQVGSDFVPGVTDLSAPVLKEGTCVAAITLPFVQRPGLPRTIAEAIDLLCDAARQISRDLQY
jgi:DNA-binding IclR family transcriptional regulator